VFRIPAQLSKLGRFAIGEASDGSTTAPVGLNEEAGWLYSW